MLHVEAPVWELCMSNNQALENGTGFVRFKKKKHKSTSSLYAKGASEINFA